MPVLASRWKNRPTGSSPGSDEMFMHAYAPQTYALLRIVTGFLFLWHGAQKLVHVPMPPPMQLPSFVVAIAGPIELFGGILVMIGLFTSWATFLCS